MSFILKFLTFLLSSSLIYLLYRHLSSQTSAFLPPDHPQKTEILQEFKNWSLENNRTYSSEEEFTFRFSIFSANYQRIQTFNSNPNKTHFLALNNFSDLTRDELTKYTRGHKHGRLLHSARPMNLQTDATPLPTSIDWRTLNAVTPIKNQGDCGACWAFSTIVGLEGLYALKNGTLKTFSEQNLIDCSTNGPNTGCAGGDPEAGYDYIRMIGVEYDSDYPFIAADEKCHKDLSLPRYQIKGYVQVTANDSDQLAAAVAKQPVSICIDGEDPDFLSYKGGIYTSSVCTTDLGHCLAIVGYGSENGVDYWIVKNSYGTSWGENGYVRMIKQSGTGPDICGITLEAIYPVSL